MTQSSPQFERIASCTGALGGLAWDGRRLLFAAIDESRILVYDTATRTVDEFRRYTNRTIGIALAPDGRIYGAQSASRRIVSFNSDGTTTCPNDRIDGQLHNQPWGVCVDSLGRVWFTDPHIEGTVSGPLGLFPELNHASVLRLGHSSQQGWMMTRTTFDTTRPRGLQISRDGQTLYLAEDPVSTGETPELRAYPISHEGELGGCSVLHRFDHGLHPQGIAVIDGAVLVCVRDVALDHEHVIYQVSTSGQSAPITIPVPEPAVNCLFVDAYLYVAGANGNLYRAEIQRFTARD